MTPPHHRPRPALIFGTFPAPRHTGWGYRGGMREPGRAERRIRPSILLRLVLVTGLLLGIVGMHGLTASPPAAMSPVAAFLSSATPDVRATPSGPSGAAGVTAAASPEHLVAVAPPCCTVASDPLFPLEPAIPASLAIPSPAATPYETASTMPAPTSADGRDHSVLIPLRI